MFFCKNFNQAYKPSSVLDDHLSRPIVAEGLMRPYPGTRRAASSLLYLVLLRVGFAQPTESPQLLVSSYLTFSSLPGTQLKYQYKFLISKLNPGRFFSVALSLKLPSLGIIQHPALWSSDFPHATACDHLAWLKCFIILSEHIYYIIQGQRQSKICLLRAELLRSVYIKRNLLSSVEISGRSGRCLNVFSYY